MNKRTFIEAIIAAMIFAAEIVTVFVNLFYVESFIWSNAELLYILIAFTAIEVIYCAILAAVNANRKK